MDGLQEDSPDFLIAAWKFILHVYELIFRNKWLIKIVILVTYGT